MSVTFKIKASEAQGRRLDSGYHHAVRRTRIRSAYPSAKLLSLSYFRTGGTPSTAHPECWNGSIPWVSAKDFKAFRFDDSEDHVTELALAEINAVHEWICAEDSEKGCCQALFYVRRTIQNGWSYGVLRNWLSTELYECEGKAQTNFAYRVRISSFTRMRFPYRRIMWAFSRPGTRPSSRLRKRPHGRFASLFVCIPQWANCGKIQNRS